MHEERQLNAWATGPTKRQEAMSRREVLNAAALGAFIGTFAGLHPAGHYSWLLIEQPWWPLTDGAAHLIVWFPFAATGAAIGAAAVFLSDIPAVVRLIDRPLERMMDRAPRASVRFVRSQPLWNCVLAVSFSAFAVTGLLTFGTVASVCLVATLLTRRIWVLSRAREIDAILDRTRRPDSNE